MPEQAREEPTVDPESVFGATPRARRNARAEKIAKVGTLLMALALVAPVFMTLMGCTAGGAVMVMGAVWAELYGTAHLGAIRALSVSLLVLATAIAPGAMGWLMDRGVTLELQFALMSAYTLACALGFALLLPGLWKGREPPVLVSR